MFWLPPKQPANQRKQTKMAERKVAAALIAILIFDDDETKRRGKTRSWIKRRKQRGAFETIMQELRIGDTAGFKEMLRMEYSTFLHLLSLVEPCISSQEIYHGTETIKKPTKD